MNSNEGLHKVDTEKLIYRISDFVIAALLVGVIAALSLGIL